MAKCIFCALLIKVGRLQNIQVKMGLPVVYITGTEQDCAETDLPTWAFSLTRFLAAENIE